VNGTNYPPTISVASSVTINAGQTLLLTVMANDPNPFSTLTFSPMSLGIRMVFGELFPRSGPGAFEFGDIFLEGSNGARFGGAPFAAFGQTGLGDPAQ
jgi:hypothetical protein